MPEINIRLDIRCLVREENHREAVIETARQGAEQVLNNVLMLTASNSKIQPRITMLVTEHGREEEEYDIIKDVVAALPANYEDPFA